MITRRKSFALAGSTALSISFLGRSGFAQQSQPSTLIEKFSNTHDRVWLGGEVWANPMEDWAIADGWAQCQTTAANRSVHSLTHQITAPGQSFAISVEMDGPEKPAKDSGGGLRIGCKTDINEYRSNCFAKGGINAGVTGSELVLGKKKAAIKRDSAKGPITLLLNGTPKGDSVALQLVAADSEENLLGSIEATVKPGDVTGNIAVVSNYQGPSKRNTKPAYRFRNWKADGAAFSVQSGQKFGPLLWSMYSLSDSRGDEGFVMKMNALTGPLGKADNQKVQLEIKTDGDWKQISEATLDKEAWVATFRIPNWNQKRETPYRLIYNETQKDGSKTRETWSGKILANPSGRPLRLAALTCQNDYAYPYEPVANNVVNLAPDMLYFSGDQLYESHGGFGIIREPAAPAILNYLRKYYQFGWAFREAMKNAPTICLPDDHDVFQGNIWGEGGQAMKELDKGASSKGGYREPAAMVNVVHKTSCGHHPDFYDPTPVAQDISVYYGDMVYGDVSFAILGDRQWKSGPENVDTGSGRADHVPDPDFDTSTLDKPGLVLLGERQEKFLTEWSKDWRGHSMKVLLTQTVFGAMATHHGRGGDGMYLKADLDSGGWPQTPRNNAIRILRDSMALHINGDQHLTTLTQYGVDKQRDSNWSFCTPAIAVGYPRWWRPDEVGMPHKNRPDHGVPFTGEYLDGLGNKVYVYAVGNPESASEKDRYQLAHQKASGFGFVTIDTKAKTYHLESFRFLVDATDGNPANQFPGWPVTIHQKENRGENILK